MKPGGIVCAGRIYCDLNFSGIGNLPRLGREVFADQMSLHAGGGAFITGAHLAALGQPTWLAGYLPASPFDDVVSRQAAACSLELQLCTPAVEPSAQLTVAMVLDGDRAFLSHRPGRALPPTLASWLPAMAERGTITHLHVSELSTLCETPALVDIAHRAGLTVSLDCAWDEASLARDDIAGLIASVDVFLPNESEMQQLRVMGIGTDCAPLTVEKQGARGATAFSGGRQWQADAAACDTVVDTIGAGDAFNAGFLAGWLQQLPLPRCLHLGNACGALAVSRRGGADHLPDLRYLLG